MGQQEQLCGGNVATESQICSFSTHFAAINTAMPSSYRLVLVTLGINPFIKEVSITPTFLTNGETEAQRKKVTYFHHCPLSSSRSGTEAGVDPDSLDPCSVLSHCPFPQTTLPGIQRLFWGAERVSPQFSLWLDSRDPLLLLGKVGKKPGICKWGVYTGVTRYLTPQPLGVTDVIWCACVSK